MCWSNYMATPIVLKKPLKVYKVGIMTLDDSSSFISLYQNFVYPRFKVMPTVAIKPEFTRRNIIRILGASWIFDTFCINEGYHSYLTEEMAKCNREGYDEIGIFEIPANAIIYVNYKYKEVVSTDIKYLGLLKE